VTLERPPHNGPGEPRRPRQPRPIFRVRIHETKGTPVSLGELGHRFADTGDNLCVQIVETEAGPHPSFRVVPRFHAQGELPALPEGVHAMGTLHRKDTVLVHIDGLPRDILSVVQKLSGEPRVDGGTDVVIRDARDSRSAKVGNNDPILRIRSSGAWNAARVRTVQIDSLGRIRSWSAIYVPD
jgi:hypothetical protein